MQIKQWGFCHCQAHVHVLTCPKRVVCRHCNLTSTMTMWTHVGQMILVNWRLTYDSLTKCKLGHVYNTKINHLDSYGDTNLTCCLVSMEHVLNSSSICSVHFFQASSLILFSQWRVRRNTHLTLLHCNTTCNVWTPKETLSSRSDIPPSLSPSPHMHTQNISINNNTHRQYKHTQ